MLLCWVAFRAAMIKAHSAKADMTQDEKDMATRTVWSELNYLVVLPLIAAL